MTSQPPSESAPKAEESEPPEDKVTRGNFEALAKGLFRVTPEELAAEQARQKALSAPSKRRQR